MSDLGENEVTQTTLLHPEHWMVLTGAAGGRVPARHPPSPARVAWSAANAHRNTNREILLCLAGNDYFGLNGQLYPARPGRLFIIDPGVPHDNYYPPETCGLEHIWINLLGDRISASWIQIEAGRLVRVQDHLAILMPEQIGVSLAAFPSATAPICTRADVVRLHLLTGLTAVYLAEHRTDDQSHAQEQQPPSLQQRVVDTICRHIDQEAGRGVTLDLLAHFAGYSKFHLLRLFRAQTGLTVHQYVDKARRRRLQELKHKRMTNQAIADELGFSSPTAFIRWRKQKCQVRTGMPIIEPDNFRF